ncbi:MAG: hypothetical protein ACLR4C_03215 [Eubacterium ventriosum]
MDGFYFEIYKAMKELKDIKSYNLKELKKIQQLGEKPFRAGIYKWLHVDKVKTFDEMTNISKFKTKLSDEFEIRTLNR